MKRTKWPVLWVVVLLLLIVLAACVPAATSTPPPTPTAAKARPEAERLIIGSLYITPTGVPWSAAHKTALANVLYSYAAEIGGSVEEIRDSFRVLDSSGREVVRALAWTVTTDYSSTAALSAAGSMIQQGAKLIFVTAEDWCQELKDQFAPDHPEVNFACIRGPVAENLISMYPKSWAGFCAAGAAAAATVDKPLVGLGGAYENNPQVASNHGAFAACFADAWRALGKAGEPRFATVYIDSWGDEPKEHEAALALADAGVRVVAVHQDSTEYAEALAERADFQKGEWIWVVGYDRDWAQFTTPNRHILTSVVIDWTGVYQSAFRMTLNGGFSGFRWNPGFEGGAITLARFSPEAPERAKILADEYQQKLLNGWRPCGDDGLMWSLDHWNKCYQGWKETR